MSEELLVTKSSGEKAKFSKSKLMRSLKNSGADDITIARCLDEVRDKIYHGVTSKEIYETCNRILKEIANPVSLRYQLKMALMDLGPEGYPFEIYVSRIFDKEGFTTKNGVILKGYCITHEIDVLAKKQNDLLAVECKFHSEVGRKTRVKTPLYIHSRFRDLISNSKSTKIPTKAVIATNTRFTIDAEQYSDCYDIQLLSWDFPKGNALKDKIDTYKLYPITVSNQLTAYEKAQLIEADYLLCSDLVKRSKILEKIGVSGIRKSRILSEMESLLK